ncbi:MAG: metal ABC transporter ATP-binding protein [Candidatus Eremiobacter antarcticus]|nr:metal ABC transporter ATP-binding protein [Candidatus Eremiobacteraeota bacterium]MBC5807946.1 metal ABC transporter ATP-binding protein [Candidatus Eremiobacteraeota bacterium]
MDHDHTHVLPADVANPREHSHTIAPAGRHLHAHAGHRKEIDRPVGERMSEAVALQGVCAGYFGRDVLDEISFEVAAGDFIGVIGPNGSGKSTLLKVIAGLLPVQCGSVRVFGRAPDSATRRMLGYVPQIESVNWSFPVTVFDAVLMGTYGRLGFFRRPSAADREAAHQALADVGMSEHADSQIAQLSGGQQQRVFIARSLVQHPKLLLLDEPIAGVDATTQHAIFTLLEKLQKAGATIIVTTHDLSCVAEWFDRVLCLNHRLIAFGPPSEVLNAQTLSATFGSHVLFGTAAS